MSHKGYTPGPWMPERRNGWHDIVPEDGDTVARVHDVMDGDGGFSNARIIAAAPTLLEAALGAIAALSQAKTFPADIEAAKAFLGAAIAKAGGES